MSQSSWFRSWHYIRTNKMLLLGCMVLTILVLAAAFLPSLYPDYERTAPDYALQAPSTLFPFGTDNLGRCMLARTLQGIRLSLLIAVSATIIDVCFGLLWSTIALACGKKVANFMSRVTEILFSVPRIPVIILLLVIFNHGILPLILAMTITGWIPIARIIYGQFLLLENKEFVLSARALQASTFHILRKHLLPNTLGPIISTLIFTIPNAVYTEAFISFLGLGIQPPYASLGTLVKEGIHSLDYHPWLFFVPSFFMVIVSVSFNCIGEGLRTTLLEENTFV
ncbi:ABC transporter permease [Chlamydia suis]|uniref:ABC transporter permease n=1 Tax=Chlamydia suis TaxID=83559 RepID=UPI0009B0B98D|nr:ABC transporter permease [Chlamydia suis]